MINFPKYTAYTKIENETLKEYDKIKIGLHIFTVRKLFSNGYYISRSETYHCVQNVLMIINIKDLLIKYNSRLIDDVFIYFNDLESLTSFCKFILNLNYDLRGNK